MKSLICLLFLVVSLSAFSAVNKSFECEALDLVYANRFNANGTLTLEDDFEALDSKTAQISMKIEATNRGHNGKTTSYVVESEAKATYVNSGFTLKPYIAVKISRRQNDLFRVAYINLGYPGLSNSKIILKNGWTYRSTCNFK